ncbi:MAG: hypothetical protein H0V68_07145 [Actinobacteria bacterium]|nr:hypothetical protein [Actinomycetota bacterium]
MSAAAYETLVERARADADVVGLVLTGSRGRGFKVRSDSDFDVRLVVAGASFEGCAERYATPHGSPVEVSVLRLSTFALTGMPGSGSEWDRYSYVRAEPVLDKLGGEVAALLTRKATLAEDEAASLAPEALDDYVNSYYRSARNHQNGLALESQLDAAESIGPLLTTLFAFERRVRPFNKFLVFELELEPLPGDAWAADRLVGRVRRIVSSGDLRTQQELFRDVEALARERGRGHVIDGWEPDVAWLRSGVS